MREDGLSGVTLLGSTLPYQDGAESALLDIMSRAGDRSTGSDELVESIEDWPTRYHLARQRANLLRPLRIEPGLRVLDIGAGTGALSRYLGEQGASVVALEGSLERARVAAARCDDLPNVEIVCGPLEAYEAAEPFDIVLVIGVLEYASEIIGGSAGPARFLARVRELTSPSGASVIAIENQIGLKYLLGYAEDHAGEPWIGVEGYPGLSDVRTYPRSLLADLLASQGLEHQRWLFPFPDYKLPRVVLAEAAYEQPDATVFVDQLVGNPVRDYAHPRLVLADDRGAHRVFLEAGLGREVANSFLLVTSETEAGAERFVVPDAVAWHFGEERLREWLRGKVIREGNDGLTVEAEHLWEPGRPRARGWLKQNPGIPRTYVSGPTVEQLARAGCASHDLHEVARVLNEWRTHLASLLTPRAPEPPAHPFVLEGTGHVLPSDHLDVDLGNFVVAEDGLHYIDAEWELSEGIDPDIACVRALWQFAVGLVTSGAEYPWSPAATVDDITISLGELCALRITPRLLDTWKAAENQLQEKVTGRPIEEHESSRRETSGLSQRSFGVTRQLPFSKLRREVRELEGLRGLADAYASLKTSHGEFVRHHETLKEDLGAAQQRIAELDVELGASARLAVELTEQLEAARAGAEAERQLSAARLEEIERWQARYAALERRWPVRVARLLLRRRPQ